MSAPTSTNKVPVVAVAFYSTWGHIGQLAEEVIKGVKASGAECRVYCFQETLSEEILTKMYAGSSLKPKYPILKPDDLKEIDGLIIGAGTRYGRVPAQVSTFFDACGGLWASGALVGKFATMFTGAAGQHGGHETTALTTMPFFVHQGMCYVPIGYANPKLNELEKVQGGSGWGASTVSAGDGHLQPTPDDLAVSEYQGKYFGDFVSTFVKGKHFSSNATRSGTTSAAKEVPIQQIDAEKAPALGYPVDVAEPANPASAPLSADETPQAVTAAVPPPAQKAETAPAPVAPAASQPKTAVSSPAQPKKKGGLFASCCGGSGIDN